MRLIEGGGRRRKFVRQDYIESLRDVGGRLEMLMGRYEALVTDVARAVGPVSDFNGRLDLVNSQLAFITRRLQELFLIEHDARIGVTEEEAVNT
jgi:hypothetical protein